MNRKLTFWAVTGVHCFSIKAFPSQESRISPSRCACVAQLEGGGSFIAFRQQQDRVQKNNDLLKFVHTTWREKATENAGHFHIYRNYKTSNLFYLFSINSFLYIFGGVDKLKIRNCDSFSEIQIFLSHVKGQLFVLLFYFILLKVLLWNLESDNQLI